MFLERLKMTSKKPWKQSVKIILGGLPNQKSRNFPGSYEKTSGFQGIKGLETRTSKF